MKPDERVYRQTGKELLFFFLLIFCFKSSLAQYVNETEATFFRHRQTGFRFGKWSLHPALNFMLGYDSNVLFLNVNPQSDLYYEAAVGPDIVLEGVKTKLILGYRFKRVDFFELNVQDYNAHNVFFNGAYAFSRRFSIQLQDTYEQTSDPADEEIPERIERTSNNASVELLHQTPGNDLQTGLKYSNIYQKYDTELAGLSFYSNKVFVTSKINISSKFRFLPKSVLILGAEYGTTDFNDTGASPENSDSQGWSLTTGLNSQFSRKIDLLLQFGVAALYFDQGPDTTSAIWSLNAGYRFSPRTNVTLGYQRKLERSQFTNYFNEDAINFQFRVKPTEKLDIGIEQKASFIAFSGPNVVPSGEEREDEIYQTSFKITYELKPWLKPKASYNYILRNSNSTSFFVNSQPADFDKHVVNAGVDLYY